jgi:heme A synthase
VSTSERPGLYGCAVCAAVCGLLAVLSGAMVTSGADVFKQLHEIVAGIASVAIAILGIWMIAKQPVKLGWTLLALLLTEGALGPLQQGAAVGVLHACLGQILFAATVAAAVYTSSSWAKEPELVEDHGWPSLGSLGKITPVFVLGQIALGAAFRHKALGVMPHLVGAMIIVLLILCICIFVMQQFPAHATLRPCANLLMAIAFTQMFLGIAAFTVRTMTTIATSVVIGVTSAHATVGALTLAAAVILQMQIRRNVRPRRQEEEAADPAAS